jgi:hypothetical protein
MIFYSTRKKKDGSFVSTPINEEKGVSNLFNFYVNLYVILKFNSTNYVTNFHFVCAIEDPRAYGSTYAKE